MEVISDNIYKKLEKDYLPSTIKRWDKLLEELIREGFVRRGAYSEYYESLCNTQQYSEIVGGKDNKHLYYEALYRVLNELKGLLIVAIREYGDEGIRSPLTYQLGDVVEDYQSRYNITRPQ